jgi:hypothetical protein
VTGLARLTRLFDTRFCLSRSASRDNLSKCRAIDVTRVPGVPSIRLVVALDMDGATRPAGISDATALPLPAILGLTDSMLELVGLLAIEGAGLRDRIMPRSGLVPRETAGEGLVFVRLEIGRAGISVARRVIVGWSNRDALCA